MNAVQAIPEGIASTMSLPTWAQRPIFIGGLSYSGKTPLRIMLSAHPNILLTRRTYMWNKYYGRYGALVKRTNFERCLSAMMQNKQIVRLDPDLDRIRKEFWAGEPSYARLFGLFHMHYAERYGKARWGDQLGLIERYADELFAAFPQAKMIHMVRDPRSRYVASLNASRYKHFKLGQETRRWLDSVALLRRNQQKYPGSYMTVRYEELMAEPEATVQAVCAFIGEDFVPEMIHAFDSTAAQPAVAAHERADQFIQAHAQREMAGLGYRLEGRSLSLNARILYCLVDWPAGRAGMAAMPILASKQMWDG